MSTHNNPAWAELIQLLPVISLALPFIIQGSVDLSQAAGGLLLGAVLFVAVNGVLLVKRQLLNPILVGTGLWLCLGALAFNIPITPLRDALIATQAFGLFVGALLAGSVATVVSPHGYIACRSSDAGWQRRTSLVLLGLTVVMLVWAWLFRHDIRVGGGLPFIVLNMARRMMCRRAPK